jgi:hypothetical protein
VIRPLKRLWPVLAALAVILVWLVVVRPGQARKEQKIAEAQSAASETAAATGQATARINERSFENEGRIKDLTARGSEQVREAQGADTPIPPAVAAAGRAAICLHDDYADTAACTALLEVPFRPFETAEPFGSAATY